MRLHGYCMECKRFRVVTLAGAAMGTLGRGVPWGVCDQCADEEKEQRRERR